MVTEVEAIACGVCALYDAIQERELVSPYYKGKQAGLAEVLKLIVNVTGGTSTEATKQLLKNGEEDA